MKKLFSICSVLFSSFFGICQEDSSIVSNPSFNDSIAFNAINADELLNEIVLMNDAFIKEDEENTYTIEELVKKLQTVERERDSLWFQYNLLESDLLLTQSQQMQTVNDEGDRNSAKYRNAKKYYLVLSSAKIKENIDKAYERLKTAGLEHPLSIYYDQVSKWYHVVLNETISLSDIREKVMSYRERGFEGTWVLAIYMEVLKSESINTKN